MPITADIEGRKVSFPDDATPEEITEAVNAQFPAAQAKPATPEAAEEPHIGSTQTGRKGSWKDAIFGAVVDTGKQQAAAVEPFVPGTYADPRLGALQKTTEFELQKALDAGPMRFDSHGKYIPTDAAKTVVPMLTPANAALTVATAGSAPVGRLAAGSFGAMGAKGLFDAAKVLRDPNAKEDEKHDAALSMFVNAPMAAGGIHAFTKPRIAQIPKSADILTRAKAAAVEALKEKGKPDASEVSKATEVHGNVQPQPVEGAGKVPAQVSGAGVQSHGQEGTPQAVQSEIPLTPADTGLSEEHHKLLMDEVERGGHDVEVVTGPIAENEPFARQIASINRSTGKIRINPKELSDWLTHDVPKGKQAEAMRSLLGEERIHLATTDADALKYHDSLTAAERAIGQRVYVGKGGQPLSPTLLGHELVRQRMQKIARMGVRETIDASRKERWTVKSLLALSDAIRTVRETLGTKASKEGLAIMDKVKENLDGAIAAKAGEEPGAAAKDQQDDYDEYNRLVNQYKAAPQENKVFIQQQIEDIKARYKGLPPKPSTDEPAARRKTKDKETTGFYLPPIEGEAERPGAKELGALPAIKIDPSIALHTDTVHWNKPNAWRRVTSELLSKPYSLGKQLTEGSRTGEGEPVSTTKRLVALEKNGKVDVVSIYPDADDGARLVDPGKAGKTKRPNVTLKTLLDEGYKPIVSMLRTEGVQNFHRHFDSREQFEQTVGRPGDDMWAQVRSYEAEPANPQASSFGQGSEMVDAEAEALHDHMIEHETPEAAIDAIAASPQKQQLRSAFGKAINQIMGRITSLTREQAAGLALKEFYENAHSENSRRSFIKSILDTFGQEAPESAGRIAIPGETPSHFEEVQATHEGGETNPEGRTIPVEAGELEGGAGTEYDPDLSLLRGEAEPAAIRKYASDQLKLTEDDIKDAMTKNVVAGKITRAFGNAQNLPNLISQAEENRIRMASAEKPKGIKGALQQWRRGKKDVLAAANAVVQAQGVRKDGTIDNGRKSQLRTFMAQVQAGNAEAQKWIASGNWRQASMGRKWLRSNAELMKELQFAETHWNDRELQQTAIRMKQSLDEQWAREQKSGISVSKDPNYDPQRYDAAVWNEHSILFNAVNGTEKILGGKFRRPKTFPTYYAAAEAGPYIPVTRDGASLVSHRVRQGMSLIERNAWAEGLKAMKTPSGEAVAVEPKNVKGQLTAPSRNYEVIQVGNKWMAVHEDFQNLVEGLTEKSGLGKMPGALPVVRGSMIIKHTTIIGDVYHLAKTAMFGLSIIGPRETWNFQKGSALLDINPRDYAEAVRKGIVSQKDVDWATEKVPYGNKQISRRELAFKFLKEGANLGKIQDALYKDLVTQQSPGAGGIGKAWSTITDPSIGRWNRFLFDSFTRGVMAKVNLLEFERQSKANPKLNPDALIRDIARDTNNRFGNIGKQGWIKSSTWQDVQRLMWFAPNWEAGIIKSELGAYGRAAGVVARPLGYRKNVTPFGTSGRSMAVGLGTLMALAQVANIAFRGKPTWQNEEEGHKFDAYIPGTGDEPGYWFSPASVFNETVNDLWRYKQSDKTFMDAVDTVQGNKESAIFRAAMIAAAGTGRVKSTTSLGQLKQAGQQLVPVPITFGRIGQAAGHAIAPNVVPPAPPGAVPRQIASSLGIKLEPKFSDAQEVQHRAKAFAKEAGFAKETGWQQQETDEPSYSKLRTALRVGDEKEAKRQLDELRKSRTDKQIFHAMKLAKERPFTGSKAGERAFIRSLDDRELEQYQKAIEEQDALYEKWQTFALNNL